MLLRRHLREQARDLEGADQALADPLHGAEARYVIAVENDAPRARTKLSGHQINEGGLAGAVRADERDPLARRHGEGDIPADGKAAEIFGQAFDAEEVAHARPPLMRLPEPDTFSTRPLRPPGAAITTAISRAPTMVIQWNGLIAET
jgi:hypothetical protein